MLRVVVTRSYVDLVPGEVGVAEDDEVSVGEPASQPSPASGCGSAVVHQTYGASAELERDPLGQLESMVGVPGDCVNIGVRCAVTQGLED